MEASRYEKSRAHRLDLTFAGLAHPLRREILVRLASGELSVNELAEPFKVSQPAISRHLKVLERAGLISTAADAQRRPRRLEAQPLAEATDWLLEFREFWASSFERLDELLDELQAAAPKRQSRAAKPRVGKPR